MLRIFKWVLAFALVLVVAVYALFRYIIESRYNVVSQNVEIDIETSKKDTWCIQNADLLVNQDDPGFNRASPKKAYLELFLFRNDFKARAYSSLVYTKLSRHYLQIAKEKIGFKSMGAWHLNGIALILAIEEKISKDDLALLYCHLGKPQGEDKERINHATGK